VGPDHVGDEDAALERQEADAIGPLEGHDSLVEGDGGVLVKVDLPGLVPLVRIAGGLDGQLGLLAGEPEPVPDFLIAEPAQIKLIGGTMGESDAGHKVGGGVEGLHGRLELGDGGVVRQELNSSDQLHAAFIGGIADPVKRRGSSHP
jgi:hypothetical protein